MTEERLVEGEDYTVENGLYVFTRNYLLRRGTCCKSGCRNCPYGFVKGSGPGNETSSNPDPPAGEFHS